MQFNSLLFIYWFLPVALLFYFITPGRLKNLMLLAVSLVFYALSGIFALPVLIGSIVMNYAVGLMIGSRKEPAGRKQWLAVGIVLNIALLAVFKYSGFILQNLDAALHVSVLSDGFVSSIIQPLGISYFTFKAISYLISVRRGEMPVRRNLPDLALYIAVFPELLAGPIDRYRDLSGQIDGRKVTPELFASGVRRFVPGLFKKVIIATPLGTVADQVFSMSGNSLNTPLVWFGAFCYTLQIYYDFSGYSDMAIGLGRMFGFRFMENFNFPYISRSIHEFWRRWHISLSVWLRDYLFLPLAYATSRLLKKERYLTIRADHIIYVVVTIITFLVCGLWHGPAWHFVSWGLIHGIFLSLERTPFGKWLHRGPGVFAHLYFILVITLSMVFFRAETLISALKFTGIMFGLNTQPVVWSLFGEFFDPSFIVILIIAISGCTTVFDTLRQWFLTRIPASGTRMASLVRHAAQTTAIFLMILIMIIATIHLVSGTNTPFIYFKF